ncbi:shikimate kinase [Labedella endophytica]|nr:shikimate kinase [Labedella endophytica]
MSDPDVRALVLIGPMAAGKSKIGRRVARHLGVPFTDTDRMIVSEHGPIPAIFESEGEDAFRAYERAAVARSVGKRSVVSLGGGAVLHPDTATLLESATVVYLTVSAEVVRSRIAGSNRPLLTDGIESWERIFAERRPTYERLATATWDTSRLPISRLADEIADWARGRI